MVKLLSRLGLAYAGLGCLLALAPAPAAAETAGYAGAVNLDVSGTPPGGSPRAVTLGNEVVRDERIQTTATGLAQILFLDQTTLTVGPNSDVVIDAFVYDPASGQGSLLMETGLGLVRIIGGGVSKSEGIQVETPTATLGIRGSNVVVQVFAGGATRVTCTYCESVSVASRLGDESYRIRGTDRFRTVDVDSEGGISDAYSLPAEQQASVQQLLTSRPGQSGGLAAPPTEAQVAPLISTAANSDKVASEVSPSAPPPILVAARDTEASIPPPIVEQSQQDSSQDNAEQGLKDEAGGGGTPVQPGTVGGRWVLSPPSTAQGWLGNPDDPDVTQGVASAQVQGETITLVLDGGGRVVLPYRPGGSFGFDPGGTASPAGPVTGDAYVAEDGSFFYYSLALAEDPSRRAIVFGGTPLVGTPSGIDRVMAYDIVADPTMQSPVPFVRGAMLGGIDGEHLSTTPFYFVARNQETPSLAGVYGTAALGIQGEGRDQETFLMVTTAQALESTLPTGAVRAFHNDADGGSIRATGNLGLVPDGFGRYIFGNQDEYYFVISSTGWSEPQSNDTLVEVHSGGDGGIPYRPIHVVGAPQPPAAGVGDDRPRLSHVGFAAGVAQHNGATIPVSGVTGLFLQPTGSSESSIATITLLPNAGFEDEAQAGAYVMTFGKAVYIDRERFMMQELAEIGGGVDGVNSISAAGALVSWDLVQLAGNQLPGGVTPCECDFMEWGFWAYHMVSQTADGGTREDSFPIGTWIAGDSFQLPTQLPTTGSASYAGHAVASIVTRGTDGNVYNYLAAGGLNATANFGARTVQGNISNLDGRDYSFHARDQLAPVFVGSGRSGDGQVGIDVLGSFFADGERHAAGIGGSFTLGSQTPGLYYHGAGTFMGQCNEGAC